MLRFDRTDVADERRRRARARDAPSPLSLSSRLALAIRTSASRSSTSSDDSTCSIALDTGPSSGRAIIAGSRSELEVMAIATAEFPADEMVRALFSVSEETVTGEDILGRQEIAPTSTADNLIGTSNTYPTAGESKRFVTEDFKSRNKAYRDADYDA